MMFFLILHEKLASANMWAVEIKIARHLWFWKVGLAVYMRGYLRSICTILEWWNKFPNWEFITQALPQ